MDATVLQAARRVPARTDQTGGDGDAAYMVKEGRPDCGYRANVAVDGTHTLIRAVTLTGAKVHNSREFETVVKGADEMVIADKVANARRGRKQPAIRRNSASRSSWAASFQIENPSGNKNNHSDAIIQRSHAYDVVYVIG